MERVAGVNVSFLVDMMPSRGLAKMAYIFRPQQQTGARTINQ